MMHNITSLQHPIIKEINKLKINKTYRYQTKRFFIEGPKSIAMSFEQKIEIDTLLITQKYYDKQQANLINEISWAKETIIINDSIAHKISDTQSNQGIFAIAFMAPIKKLTLDENQQYLILDHLQDPGNIGTIIRTANAFNIQNIILSGNCPDIYNPKIIRSTMGGIFNLNIHANQSLDQLIPRMKDKHIKVFGTTLAASSSLINDIDLARGAIIVGNESNGLSRDTIKHCDALIKIKMDGDVESLNVAVAASIVMYKMQNDKI